MKPTRCFLTFLSGVVSLLISCAALADGETQIGKALTPQGDLKSVVVMTHDILFYVSPTGQIQKVTPNPNSPPSKDKAASDKPLNTQYKGSSALTGGRRLTKVNDIEITYYSAMGNPSMRANGVKNSAYGNSPTGNNTAYSNNSLAQSIRNQRFSEGPDAMNRTPNGRKVRSIGDVPFSYYKSNNRNGNGGKINRVGEYRITYYNRNDLTGRGGKVRSFKK